MFKQPHIREGEAVREGYTPVPKPAPKQQLPSAPTEPAPKVAPVPVRQESPSDEPEEREEEAPPRVTQTRQSFPIGPAPAPKKGGFGGIKFPKFGNPFAGVSGKFSGLGRNLPEGWYIWAIGGVVALLAFLYFQMFGLPKFVVGSDKALVLPGAPGLVVFVTLSGLALVITCLMGLIEAQSREDPFLMDWWIPFVAVGILVWGQLHGYETMGWGFAAGFAACALIFATLWNPSEQEDISFLDRMDTTAVFQTCFVLGMLYFGKWVDIPYPEFIPPVLVAIIGALALFKELIRTPKFALLVVGLGVAAAVFYTPWWIAGTLAVAVIAANAGASQGWLPGSGQKRVDAADVKFLGRRIKLIVAWDVVIAWWAAFVLTAILLYGDHVLFVIGG